MYWRCRERKGGSKLTHISMCNEQQTTALQPSCGKQSKEVPEPSETGERPVARTAVTPGWSYPFTETKKMEFCG